MLRGVQIILARIRLEHKYNDNVTVRFHSDIEKSFLGDVYECIEDKAWLMKTTGVLRGRRRHHFQVLA